MDGYFDYNASSLLRPEAAAALREWIDGGGGNPSSMHARGRRARLALEDARRRVAALTEGAAARDVVFTSGATESNNTVMRAFALAEPAASIVVSNVEHHSVLATADDLESRGHRVIRLQARSDATLDLAPLASLDGRYLVSLGLANGESGAVLDLDELFGTVPETAFIHLDAAQAAGRLRIPFGARVDALSMSGHKFGSPPGVGAMFVSARMRPIVRPLLTGGPQEWSLRAGTPNVPGIAAMGAAAEASMRVREAENARLGRLRDRLWQRLSDGIADLLRITPETGLANTLTLAVAECSADSMIAALDLSGFCISAGSACAAGSPEPSHVMKAIGLPPRFHGGVLRISAGWSTTDESADALADALVAVVRRAREAA
ncbi:MAG: cysteine desulfurase family protein [Candidatus Binatia bacterium]